MKNKGITLISLVITIVVLIILASVAIYLSLGNNGIFTRAKHAKELTNKQEATDIINLKITTAQMNKYAEEERMPTLKELSLSLGEDREIQYVTEKSQIASTKYEVGEEPTTIYTKLNKYPYEFEINGKLQLASINGIKIANTDSQNINQPIGIKWDTYISNTVDDWGIYEKTSMSGLNIDKDKNNKISEYLSYSSIDGYTVLKSGWYFIIARGDLAANATSCTLNVDFYINNNVMNLFYLPVNKGSCMSSTNNFPIFLTENDKIYFNIKSEYQSDNIKTANIYFYPMF